MARVRAGERQVSIHDELAHREHLACDLRNAGYTRRAFGLRGSAGTVWFETELVLTRPGLLGRCAAVLEPAIPEETDRLAARGSPALALATALSLRIGIPLVFLAEREDPSSDDPANGDGSPVAGELFPGARVVVIEDVVLTGEHARRTISALRRSGLDVIALAGLLDREQEGRFRIEEDGVRTFFAFRERDLHR
jgi:orotate phosphoribosyltransferase